jgi:integration host factor subunit beta
MTKSGLIEKVAELTPHVSKKDTEIVVNTIFDSMTEALKKGERIEIRGFGSFQVKVREAREGRNPKTGEEVQIPAKRTPFFKVGKELKERVNEGRTAAPRAGAKRAPVTTESEAAPVATPAQTTGPVAADSETGAASAPANARATA